MVEVANARTKSITSLSGAPQGPDVAKFELFSASGCDPSVISKYSEEVEIFTRDEILADSTLHSMVSFKSGRRAR